jgi:hypothetical protein
MENEDYLMTIQFSDGTASIRRGTLSEIQSDLHRAMLIDAEILQVTIINIEECNNVINSSLAAANRQN